MDWSPNHSKLAPREAVPCYHASRGALFKRVEMPESAKLFHEINTHYKLSQSIASIHLRCRNKQLTISSLSPSNAAYQSRIAWDGDDFRAQVDGKVFAGLIRNAGQTTLSLDGANLVVKSAKTKASIPTVSENKPEFPEHDSTTTLSEKELEKLRTLLPKIMLSRIGIEGTLGITCADNRWDVVSYDTALGAAVQAKGKSDLKLAFSSSEAVVVKNAFDLFKKDVTVSTSGSQLYSTAGSSKLLLPTKATDIENFDAVLSTGIACASIDVDAYQTALDAVSVLAQDNDVIRIVVSKEKQSIGIALKTDKGSLSKSFECTVKRNAAFNLLLIAARDISRLLIKEAEMLIHLSEEKDVNSVQFRSNDASYIAITSV